MFIFLCLWKCISFLLRTMLWKSINSFTHHDIVPLMHSCIWNFMFVAYLKHNNICLCFIEKLKMSIIQVMVDVMSGLYKLIFQHNAIHRIHFIPGVVPCAVSIHVKVHKCKYELCDDYSYAMTMILVFNSSNENYISYESRWLFRLCAGVNGWMAFRLLSIV